MYKLTNPLAPSTEMTCVIRLSDKAAIPINPANTDYQQYLAWLEAGNVPIPSDNALPAEE